MLLCDISIYDNLAVAVQDALLNCLGFITFCRDVCCCLSTVQISDVVTWLLKAFVLSRESPSLCQEVCGVIYSCVLVMTYNA